MHVVQLSEFLTPSVVDILPHHVDKFTRSASSIALSDSSSPSIELKMNILGNLSPSGNWDLLVFPSSYLSL